MKPEKPESKRLLLILCSILAVLVIVFIANRAYFEYRLVRSLGSVESFKRWPKSYFILGEPAQKYSQVLKLANDRRQKKGNTIYVFWYRNRDPAVEGDHWAEVEVDSQSNVVKRVDIQWYIK